VGYYWESVAEFEEKADINQGQETSYIFLDGLEASLLPFRKVLLFLLEED